MAATPWSAEHPLARWILERPRDFDLLQLLHLIERNADEAAAIGHQGPVCDEPVRLRPAMSLAFPSADIDTADWQFVDNTVTGGRILITVTFMGLYGSDSPLPTHFTEQLLPEHEEDERIREFLDLFHHRIYSLLYRCWTKYRYYVIFRPDGLDAISRVVRGFLGIETPKTADGLTLEPLRLFRYAGLVAQRPRSAAGLSGMLRDYFPKVEFEIEQCVGRWLPIDASDRNAFGLGKCTLGEDFLVGERIFDRSGKFRINVGPVDFDTYTKFLPGGSGVGELAQLTKFYCGDELAFDIQVTLKGEEVPELPLGAQGFLGRLSWTSWLTSAPAVDKTVIFPAELVAKQEPETAS